MRRLVLLALVPLAALTAGCAQSARDHAHDQFVQQFETEAGFTKEQAECVVDKFFAGRSDSDLKAFFERTELTDAESAEFARIGEECSVALTTPVSAPTGATS